MGASHVHMGGEREDLGFFVKVWEWGGFCAASSDSKSSILCGLWFVYVCFVSAGLPRSVCVC